MSRAGPFVSRAGVKLRHALDTFGISVHGLACADLGCSTGGFTNCLLQAGAARVTAVDTGYGVLDWQLRNDPRVCVRERTNVLHAPPPGEGDRVDLVVVDLGWTAQRLAIPAALRWLKPGPDGRIITLVKPQYEDKPAADEHRGILPDDLAGKVVERILVEMPALGVRVLATTPSPVRGSGGKTEGRGNLEWLVLLEPATPVG